MGKFDGVLLASDFDETFCHEGRFVHPDNLRMLEYFEAEGGRFTIATGRAVRTFAPLAHLCPINAPVVASNGAQLYDFSTGTMLAEDHLPPSITEDLASLFFRHPALGVEVYQDEGVYLYNPSDWAWYHIEKARVKPLVRPLEEIPQPWSKAIIQHDYDLLRPAQEEILTRWGDRYEAIFSCDHMLELTAKGCTKGGRVLDLAQRLGISRENVYCVGDNQNDLPMLKASAIPFAPENCTQELRDFGAVILPKCEDGTIAQLVRLLDRKY